MTINKKIRIIKAYSPLGIMKASWNADALFWDDLSHILPLIELEFPECALEIEYFNYNRFAPSQLKDGK